MKNSVEYTDQKKTQSFQNHHCVISHKIIIEQTERNNLSQLVQTLSIRVNIATIINSNFSTNHLSCKLSAYLHLVILSFVCITIGKFFQANRHYTHIFHLRLVMVISPLLFLRDRFNGTTTFSCKQNICGYSRVCLIVFLLLAHLCLLIDCEMVFNGTKCYK